MTHKPYVVRWGWNNERSFDSFSRACLFYADTLGGRDADIINRDRYDGSEDGSDGLTYEERERLEELDEEIRAAGRAGLNEGEREFNGRPCK